MSSNVTTSIEKDQAADLEKNIIKRKAQLYDIDQTLPQKNGTYLNVRVNAFIKHKHTHNHSQNHTHTRTFFSLFYDKGRQHQRRP